ncbi:DUF7563 family protein [Natronobacterium texcoconense]
MPLCTNCDRPVSIDFARTKGNGENVEWCPRCRSE